MDSKEIKLNSRSMADTANKARDAAATQFKEDYEFRRFPMIGDYEPENCFRAGWDARDEEVRRLREELSEVRQNYYEVVEQRNALVSENKQLRENNALLSRSYLREENKRLREALEKISDPRKLGHSEPDYQTRYYRLIHVADEALKDSAR